VEMVNPLRPSPRMLVAHSIISSRNCRGGL
jgi:hypothetical protein